MTLALSLAAAVHDKTDRRPFSTRLHDAVQAVIERDGPYGSAVVGAIGAAQVASLAFSYFCLEGSVRSLEEVSISSIDHIRPLGDVGGWTSLAVFSAMLMKSLLERLMGEGEYIRLRGICLEWIRENRAKIDGDPKFREELYMKIYELAGEMNARSLFTSSALSRRITALEVSRDVGGVEFAKEQKLEAIFRQISGNMEHETGIFRHFHRILVGWRAVSERGSREQSIASIFGMMLPLILITNVLLSVIGEVGLGKELYVDRQELPDTGHFGEWPINAVEAFSAAFFLHIWYLTGEGDFEIVRDIFDRTMENMSVEADKEILGKAKNAELNRLASSCNCPHFALEYSQ